MPNLGAVRRERFLTIDNPLNPPGVGWVNLFYVFKVRVSIRTYVPNLGAVRRPCRKKCLLNLHVDISGVRIRKVLHLGEKHD